MLKFYGVWVDHAHAFVVKTNPLGEILSVVELDSEVPPKNHGGLNGDEHLTSMNQNKNFEHRKNEMHKFCKEVIDHIKDADEIVLFGPGIAKNELKNEIEEVKALAPKLTRVETTDKMMTANELKETVKRFLMLPRD